MSCCFEFCILLILVFIALKLKALSAGHASIYFLNFNRHMICAIQGKVPRNCTGKSAEDFWLA